MSSRMTLSLLTIEADGGLAEARAADAEEHVLERASGRPGRSVVCSAACRCWRAPCRPAAGPASSPGRRRTSGPAISTPFTSATVIADDAVAAARASGSPGRARRCRARLTSIVLSSVVDAGGEDQVLAARQRVVDRLDAVGRLGDEEVVDRDRRVRRSARCSSVVPDGVALDGGDEDAVVARPSRRTGTASPVTRGWSPASCTGRDDAWRESTGPGARRRRRTPGSRRRCDQPSRLLLRTRNCCCEPLMTVLPSNCESAMKPPLANDGPVQ